MLDMAGNASRTIACEKALSWDRAKKVPGSEARGKGKGVCPQFSCGSLHSSTSFPTPTWRPVHRLLKPPNAMKIISLSQNQGSIRKDQSYSTSQLC